MEGSVKNLLEAEKESQLIIDAAMKEKYLIILGFYTAGCRTRRVADAKVFAEQELNKYRKDYEERFIRESEKVRQDESVIVWF